MSLKLLIIWLINVKTELACINEIIYDINNQISFQAIPVT